MAIVTDQTGTYNTASSAWAIVRFDTDGSWERINPKASIDEEFLTTQDVEAELRDKVQGYVSEGEHVGAVLAVGIYRKIYDADGNEPSESTLADVYKPHRLLPHDEDAADTYEVQRYSQWLAENGATPEEIQAALHLEQRASDDSDGSSDAVTPDPTDPVEPADPVEPDPVEPDPVEPDPVEPEEPKEEEEEEEETNPHLNLEEGPGFTNYLASFGSNSPNVMRISNLINSGTYTTLDNDWLIGNTAGENYAIDSMRVGVDDGINFITFFISRVLPDDSLTSGGSTKFAENYLDALTLEIVTNTGHSLTINMADRDDPINPALNQPGEEYSFTMSNSLIDEFIAEIDDIKSTINRVSMVIRLDGMVSQADFGEPVMVDSVSVRKSGVSNWLESAANNQAAILPASWFEDNTPRRFARLRLRADGQFRLYFRIDHDAIDPLGNGSQDILVDAVRNGLKIKVIDGSAEYETQIPSSAVKTTFYAWNEPTGLALSTFVSGLTHGETVSIELAPPK